MDTSWAPIVRLWRTVHHGRNALARPSDRVQAALLIAVVLIGLSAIPFAAAVASEKYAQQTKVSLQQTSTRHLAMATLLRDGVAVDSTNRAPGSPTPTDATWHLPDGTPRIGKISAGPGTLAGQTVPIWVDAGGNPAAAPLSAGAVDIVAVGVGLGLWLCLCLALASLYLLTRYGLDRARSARWQREWALLEERHTSP
jgi:hypothetical protein